MVCIRLDRDWMQWKNLSDEEQRKKAEKKSRYFYEFRVSFLEGLDKSEKLSRENNPLKFCRKNYQAA